MMMRKQKPLTAINQEELGVKVYDLLPKTEILNYRPYTQVRCLVDRITGSATVECIHGINGTSIFDSRRITLKELLCLRDNIDKMVVAETDETTES